MYRLKRHLQAWFTRFHGFFYGDLWKVYGIRLRNRKGVSKKSCNLSKKVLTNPWKRKGTLKELFRINLLESEHKRFWNRSIF